MSKPLSEVATVTRSFGEWTVKVHSMALRGEMIRVSGSYFGYGFKGAILEGLGASQIVTHDQHDATIEKVAELTAKAAEQRDNDLIAEEENWRTETDAAMWRSLRNHK